MYQYDELQNPLQQHCSSPPHYSPKICIQPDSWIPIPHIRTKRTLTGRIVAVSLQLSSLLLNPSNNTPFTISPYFCNTKLLFEKSSQW